MSKLDVRLFGLVFGCFWGMCVLGIGMVSNMSDRGKPVVDLFSKVYIGFRPTLIGCLIGSVWGFLDGVISGMLVAWIYNVVRF